MLCYCQGTPQSLLHMKLFKHKECNIYCQLWSLVLTLSFKMECLDASNQSYVKSKIYRYQYGTRTLQEQACKFEGLVFILFLFLFQDVQSWIIKSSIACCKFIHESLQSIHIRQLYNQILHASSKSMQSMSKIDWSKLDRLRYRRLGVPGSIQARKSRI